MKKTIRNITLLLLAVLMIFTSCNDKLQRLDEGSVNEYIFPYLKFHKADDGESVTAIVVDGAKLNTVKIPAAVEELKVNSFIGFENPEDAKSVKEIVVGSNETVITEDALKQAVNLEQVKVEKVPEEQFWGKLPDLEKEGFIFLGWYTKDGTKVSEGMKIEPGMENIHPKWSKIEETSSGTFSVKILYSYANREDVVLKVLPEESAMEGMAMMSASLECPIENARVEWQLNGSTLSGQSGLAVETEIHIDRTNQISAYIYDADGFLAAYAEAVITY